MTGIWRFAHLFDDDGQPALRARAEGWSLGEGDTPLEDRSDLAGELGVGRLLLKREDRNPGGSHKDRGLLYQVVHHRGDAPGTLVLSSSGNAAVSASAACRLTGDRLVAFVSPGTAPAKRARLLDGQAEVIETLKPINFARYAARVFGLPNLRGTQDPVATLGYRSLGGELLEELPDLDAVFTFSSSGISLQGMADGFDRLGASPALWAVQSGECVGIVRELQPGVVPDPSSPAGRLGIRTPPGAAALAERLRTSGGGALAVEGSRVLDWQQKLAGLDLSVSPEGAAVLAAIEQCRGLEGKTVVGVMTGRGNKGAEAPEVPRDPVSLTSYLEVRSWFEDQLGLEAS